MGTDASLRTTRADAGVAVASAAVAVSSSSPFSLTHSLSLSLNLSLFHFSVFSSRFLCPISIYPFPRAYLTYRGSESGRRLSSSEIDTILLLLLLVSRIASLRMASPGVGRVAVENCVNAS